MHSAHSSLSDLNRGWLVALVALAACGRTGYVDESADPLLTLDRVVLAFNLSVGQPATPELVAVGEAYDRTIPWEATASSPWILLEPSAGETAATVMVSTRTTNLAPGRHRGSVTFALTNEQGVIDSKDVIVDLNLVAPGWTELDGPYCGRVTALAADPNDDNRILAGIDGWRGVFVSEDGGASFARANLALDSHSAVQQIAFATSGRAYAAVDSTYATDAAGVWRSDDLGLTWEPTGLQLVNARYVLIDATDDQSAIVEGDGLWSTDNAGANWNPIGPGETTYFLVAHPSVAGHYLLGGIDGLLHTTDIDGSFWDTVDTGAAEHLRSFAVLPSGRWVVHTNPCGDCLFQIWGSDDDGVTWTQLDGAGLPSSHPESQLELGVTGDGLWGLNIDPVLSIDEGGLFQLVSSGHRSYHDLPRFSSLLDHPDGVLFGHTSDGVLRYEAGVGLAQARMFGCSIHDLDWHAGNDLLFGVVYPGGPFRYTPGLGFELLGGDGLNTERLNAISVDPRDPFTILVSGNNGNLWRTSDGGLNWSPSNTGLTTDNTIGAVERSPDDPDIVWVSCSYGGAFRSTDGGLSFSQIDAGLTWGVAPLSAGVAFFGGGNLSKYDASDGSFTVVVAGGGGHTIVDVFSTTDGSIWYSGNSAGLNRSTDGGATFSAVGLADDTAHPVNGVAIDPNDANHFFASSGLGVFETFNGGTSWEEIGAAYSVAGLERDPAGGGIYVGTSGGGVYLFAP